MKRNVLIALIVFIGFVVVYLFMPRTVALPKLALVKDPHLPAITGETFTFSTEKPKLVAFFFTECPNVCPMTVIDLLKVQQSLKDEGISEQQYDVVFITLDPEVDTVEKIQQYKEQFAITAQNWFFLRGTVEQTEKVAKQFNMYFTKDPDGTIVHSTTMYVVDRDNQIRAHHSMSTGAQTMNVEQLTENLKSLLH